MSRLDTLIIGSVLGGAFILCYLGIKTVFTKHRCCCPGHPKEA
jgi:hypothetical protein